MLIVSVAVASAACARAEVCVRTGDRIAFMGDSITQYGQGPCGYVSLVMKGLEIVGVKAERIDAGIGGHRSVEMLERIDRDVLDKKPQWMTFSCGVNDVWHRWIRPGYGVPLDAYRKNVSAIFDKCDAAGVKVIVLTPTMITENEDDEKNIALEPYNEYLRAEAKRRGYRLADLNRAERAGLKRLRAEKPGNFFRYTLEGVHMKYAGDCMMAWGVLEAMGVQPSSRDEIVAAWDGLVGAERIGVPLCAADYRAISARAKKAGLARSEFVRQAALKGAAVKRPAPAVAPSVSPGDSLSVGKGARIAFFGGTVTSFGCHNHCGFANLLLKGFAACGVPIEKIDAGVGDGRTPDMVARLDELVLSRNPDLVVFSAGMNDVRMGCYNAEWNVPLDEFKKNVATILDRLAAAKVRVIVATSTPVSERQHPEWNARKIDYDGFLRAEAKRRGLALADVDAAIRAESERLREPDPSVFGVTYDDCHLSYDGDRLVADVLMATFGADESARRALRDYWDSLPGAYSVELVLSEADHRSILDNAARSDMSGDDYAREAALR